jgi:hypothetical protein
MVPTIRKCIADAGRIAILVDYRSAILDFKRNSDSGWYPRGEHVYHESIPMLTAHHCDPQQCFLNLVCLWFLESRKLSTETDNGLATPQAMPRRYHIMQSSLNSVKSSSCRIRVAWWVGHFHWMLYDSRIEVSASTLSVELILMTITIVCIFYYSKWWTRRL